MASILNSRLKEYTTGIHTHNNESKLTFLRHAHTSLSYSAATSILRLTFTLALFAFSSPICFTQ
jgi:hypothetical protein